MEFENIYTNEYRKCNAFVVKVLVSIAFFIVLIWILNICGVFVVKPGPMFLMMLFCVVQMVLCAGVYHLQKFHKLKWLSFSYFAATFMLLQVGVLYSVLTFHVILMFVLPALVFSIYGNKKLLDYVMFGTLAVMVASHIASYYLGVNPEEPFTTMKTIILFGLLPKMIIYCAFMYAFVYETKHNNYMLKNIYGYAKDMHQTEEEIVRAFSEMCESKSGQTGHHVKRVAAYVNIMAEEIGIDGRERECLVTASMMHDVGKLNIPGEILDKPGKLTDEEFAVIKKHTEYGYDLLKHSPGRTMEIAAVVALNHHERWDGRGYHKVAGEEIDFYSRIMAIADVFDALVSRRSYKDKWNPEQAYEEIVSQQGKQFDPELVKVFQKCYPKFIGVLSQMPD